MRRVDDRRVGLIVRMLRRRRGWRQRDLAARSGLSQSFVSQLERGHVDRVSVGTLRQVLGALDARAALEVRWRGGDVDRLLDERHAALVGEIVGQLRHSRWLTAVEVTYARFGERGSIDVLAHRPDVGALLIVEVKSELTSLEETLRRLDQKVRLAPEIARERLDGRPSDQPHVSWSCPRPRRQGIGSGAQPLSWTRRCPCAVSGSGNGSNSRSVQRQASDCCGLAIPALVCDAVVDRTGYEPRGTQGAARAQAWIPGSAT